MGKVIWAGLICTFQWRFNGSGHLVVIKFIFKLLPFICLNKLEFVERIISMFTLIIF